MISLLALRAPLPIRRRVPKGSPAPTLLDPATPLRQPGVQEEASWCATLTMNLVEALRWSDTQPSSLLLGGAGIAARPPSRLAYLGGDQGYALPDTAAPGHTRPGYRDLPSGQKSKRRSVDAHATLEPTSAGGPCESPHLKMPPPASGQSCDSPRCSSASWCRQCLRSSR